MSRGTDRLLKNLKQFTDLQYKYFSSRYGQQLIDIFEFPIKLVLSPITLAYDIAGSAPRGFGVPEFISKLSYSTIFVSSPHFLVCNWGSVTFCFFFFYLMVVKCLFICHWEDVNGIVCLIEFLNWVFKFMFMFHWKGLEWGR